MSPSPSNLLTPLRWNEFSVCRLHHFLVLKFITLFSSVCKLHLVVKIQDWMMTAHLSPITFIDVVHHHRSTTSCQCIIAVDYMWKWRSLHCGGFSLEKPNSPPVMYAHMGVYILTTLLYLQRYNRQNITYLKFKNNLQFYRYQNIFAIQQLSINHNIGKTKLKPNIKCRRHESWGVAPLRTGAVLLVIFSFYLYNPT